LTQGYLVGELVRRVDGRTIRRFLADEVAGPLGADFHIGLPASEDHRVARVVPPTGDDARPGTGAPAGSIAERTFANPPLDAGVAWTEAWRRAEVSAAGGHGNARSAATVQATPS
jgi:CubicO group peptidase (beta-lactamase class C family)